MKNMVNIKTNNLNLSHPPWVKTILRAMVEVQRLAIFLSNFPAAMFLGLGGIVMLHEVKVFIKGQSTSTIGVAWVKGDCVITVFRDLFTIHAL